MGKSRNTDKYGKFKDFRKKTKNHNNPHKKPDEWVNPKDSYEGEWNPNQKNLDERWDSMADGM
jgi:hypothetical protein